MARMNFTEDNSVSKTNWLDGFVDALGMSILPGRAVTSTSHGDGRNRERTGLESSPDLGCGEVRPPLTRRYARKVSKGLVEI